MESDWQQIHQVQLPPSDGNAFGTSPNIGSIAFDTQQELLWVGDNHGRITSYYGSHLERYTSLQAHPKDEGQVLQFLFNDRGVLSLASGSIHLMTRRGLTQWHTEHPVMTRLCCMTFLDRGSSILVAGIQPRMIKMDVEKGSIIEAIHTDSEYIMMKYNRYICAATSTGAVHFLDPISLDVVKVWQAHTSSINDMDAKTDFLVTCGRSVRPHGQPPALENLAKVYDLKRLEHLAPISFPGGAAFVQIHPKMSTTSVIGSQNGQLQIIDLMNPNTANMHMLSNYMTHFVMSPSGNIWIMADQDNVLHVWGSQTKLQFNEISHATEFADEETSWPHIAIDETVPFGTVGMPYYRERLLSAWGNERPFEVGYLSPGLDPQVERSMQPARFGNIAPNPGNVLRNQVDRKRVTDSNATSLLNTNFLSEKAKEMENGHSEGRRISDAAEAIARLALSGSAKTDVPWYYLGVKIKYGKYGVQDFDFGAYNNSRYSGLETDITNSYLNPLIQLYKYTPLIRNLALHHVASSCIDENCLFCEMGFLFDMIEKANGEVCQATNFLKTYGGKEEVVAMNQTKDLSQTSLGAKMSVSNRLLLNQISSESRKRDSPEFNMDRLMTLDGDMTMRCLNCGNENSRPEPSNMINIIYPDLNTVGRSRSPMPKFSDLVKMSFSSATHTKGYCKHCRRYPSLSYRRTFNDLPPILVLDVGLDRSPRSSTQMWSTPGWLPEEIGISILPGGDIGCMEGEKLNQFRHDRNVTIFELVGFVADISSVQGQKSHLVSLVNVAISDRNPQSNNDWHLFNDFLVRKVDKEEALRFTPSWKTPVILAYQIKAARHSIEDSWKNTMDTTCLYNQGSLNFIESEAAGFALRPGIEIPQPGFHLAIDAEFVSLEQEEVEIKPDGEREVIRPVRQGTGRISALRGSGTNEGIPFIDDYIKISEPIVDHLTQYSGLSAGDLDPRRSTHALLPLKTAYKKLWLLLNLGCVFVGHGLASDFRTINIHIPPTQIVDTVKLFRPENEKRRLSLRFLAWYFLHDSIQTGNHDSIVDARTALQLWRKHQEFEDAGVLEQKLVEIYRAGPNTAFRPPAEFEALEKAKAKRRKERVVGNTGVGDAGGGGASGRLTPEIGAGSAPVTPMARPRREGPEAGYFGSPLR